MGVAKTRHGRDHARMWPFRRRQRDSEADRPAFQTYLDPDQVKAVIDKHDPGLPRALPRVGDIVLVMVRDDDLSLTPSLLAKTTDCALENGFCVEAIMSSLVLITMGPLKEHPTEAQRLEFIDRLQQSLTGNAKIAHGRSQCLRGNLGSEKRLAYGSCLPSFSKTLATLERAKFGEVIELS
jgi:hypothetical protein